ncbi:MAG: hypothetical protein ACRDDZ_06500 [Marinifilaceae bacterium]
MKLKYSTLFIPTLFLLLFFLSAGQPLRMGYDGPYLLETTGKNYRIVGVGDYGEIYDSILPSGNSQLTVSTHSGLYKFKIEPSPMEIPEMVYPQPDSLVAVSHMDGHFNEFVDLLRRIHVIDSAFNWKWGNNHLVLLGNAVGTGNDNMALLWLIYSLEQQSQNCGGKVHYILGENEEKLLNGKLRNIAPKYTDLSYNLSVPYSFFWSNNSFLAQWLKTHNTVELIGETLYMSGNKPQESKVKNKRYQDMNDGIYNLLSILNNEKEGDLDYTQHSVKRKINKIGANSIMVGFTEGSQQTEMVTSVNSLSTITTRQLPALVMYNNNYLVVEPTGLTRTIRQ